VRLLIALGIMSLLGWVFVMFDQSHSGPTDQPSANLGLGPAEVMNRVPIEHHHH